MKFSKSIFLILMGFALIFSGCNVVDNGTDPGDDPGSGGDQEHSSNITANETWAKDKIHIIDGYISISNATLTIEAGTIVKFKENSRIVVGEAGGLLADGTTEAIKFTGNVAQDGYWYYMEFQKTANNAECKLINCTIEYGGGYNSTSAMLFINNKATVKNCTIKNSSSYGVYIDDEAGPEFTGNTVTECVKGAIEAYFSSVNYIGYGTYTGNSLDYIFINDNTIVKNSTMRKQDVPYILDGYCSIKNATLTVEAGATIMMNSNSRLVVDENGGLIAVGTPTEIITFTGKIAQKGYWYYIEFDGTAISANSKLDYCKVEYGGGYNTSSSNIFVYNNATITNSVIQNSESHGIYFDNDSKPIFHDNIVTLNDLSPVEAYMKNITFIGIGDYTGNASGHNNLFINDETYTLVGTLLKQNVPYLFDGYSDIKNGTLTVAPGTQILMNSNSRLVVSTNGGFIADGATEAITISGYVKQNGYWYYIDFDETAISNNCVLNNCILEYGGGYNSSSAIVYVDNNGTVTNNTIQHSSSWGLIYENTASPTISGNTYSDNTAGDEKTH